MTIHTQDDQPPKVHMDFNRYTEIKDEEGNVIGKDPWVNTDIMLVFDEAIRSESVAGKVTIISPVSSSSSTVAWV